MPQRLVEHARSHTRVLPWNKHLGDLPRLILLRKGGQFLFREVRKNFMQLTVSADRVAPPKYLNGCPRLFVLSEEQSLRCQRLGLGFVELLRALIGP